MPKKKKSKKDLDNKAPKHQLPGGFWRQVAAVFMIALAIMLVTSWFGSGGRVLNVIHDAAGSFFGHARYLLPFVLIFLSVATFRSENNRVPIVVIIATLLSIVWFSGLFGIFTDATDQATGGTLGAFANSLLLPLVSSNIAIFIYILLIFITTLFVLSISPAAVIRKIASALRSNRVDEEDKKNAKLMKKVVEVEDNTTPQSNGKLKLNAGVPTLNGKDKQSQKAPDAKPEKVEPKTALVAINDPDWKMPGLDLLEKKQSPADAGDIQNNAQIIKNTLSEFGIDVEMESANVGPRVTQFTLRPPSGVKLTKITQLESNIMLNLEAESLRIEAPIPGQKVVGVEVPNVKSADVRLHGILDSKQWKQSTGPLSFAIGKDISGNAVTAELASMPHLLVAGQTGSGKSVMMNSILTSLLYRNSPSDLKMILIDPKKVEMTSYEDISHLLTPIVTEPEKAISALKWSVNEMERRYTLLSEEKVKNIGDYNTKIAKAGRKIAVADEAGEPEPPADGKMPYILLVVDELADLMMSAPRDIEALVVRLAQKGRAAGIHLILATQRPSVNVITGLIKANIPARIAFTVAQQVDSRTILDQIGAEKLLGKGDMLLMTPSMGKPRRIQGAWVTDEEVLRVTDFLRLQAPPAYNDEVLSQPVQITSKGGVVMGYDDDIGGGGGGSNGDPIYRDALRLAIETGKISTSMIQTRLRVGYGRASRVITQMEDAGIIGPSTGNAKPRDVLISSLDEIED